MNDSITYERTTRQIGNSRQTLVGDTAFSESGNVNAGETVAPVQRMDQSQTVYAPSPAHSGSAAAGRKIRAILVSYTHSDEGEVYYIRDGKNYIGAGRIASDASGRDCDIQIDDDDEMSSEHALILCQRGTMFQLIDKETTNGTFLNDEMIQTLQGYNLNNYDTIKTGRTEWTFIVLTKP